jgi:hypothetical protein
MAAGAPVPVVAVENAVGADAGRCFGLAEAKRGLKAALRPTGALY